MTTKKTVDEPEVAPGAPVSFRDYTGDVHEVSAPVEIAYPVEPEPAKPATPKEK